MFWGINDAKNDTRTSLNTNQNRILMKLEGLVYVSATEVLGNVI